MIVAAAGQPLAALSRPAIARVSSSPQSARHARRHGGALRRRAPNAPLVLVGQPNTDEKRIDNTLEVPSALSFLTYRRWNAAGHGPRRISARPAPRQRRPPLLQLSRDGRPRDALHGLDGRGGALAVRGRLLQTARPLLWALMLAVPLPYIANTAGWMTAEIGRQPWLVYGLMRTAAGTSHARLRRQRALLADRLHGPLRRPGDRLLPPHDPHDCLGRSDEAAPHLGARRRRPASAAEEGLPWRRFWFLLVALMLVAYVVLDGFDLGAGAIYKWVAKSRDERALVRRTIGPVWDANEVWLLAAGGTLYFAFPQLYASSFSGFYLPLMMVLWLLIGRALGLELRGHFGDDPSSESLRRRSSWSRASC